MIDTENDKDTENEFKNNNILRIFINICTWWFSGFNILQVSFKSDSLSINKKNHINIKCSLNKTLQFDKTEIFSIKLWRNLSKLYPMTTISSDHKIKYNFHGYWKWFAEINDSTPLYSIVDLKILSKSYVKRKWLRRILRHWMFPFAARCSILCFSSFISCSYKCHKTTLKDIRILD